MIGTKTEGGYVSDWLLFENTDIGRYSRDVVTVALNQDLKNGQVVGKDANGDVVAYDNETATTAGGAVAVGIMCEDVVTTTTKVKSVMVARHARVDAGKLIYKAGLVDADKAAALVDFATVGIIPVPAAV